VELFSTTWTTYPAVRTRSKKRANKKDKVMMMLLMLDACAARAAAAALVARADVPLFLGKVTGKLTVEQPAVEVASEVISLNFKSGGKNLKVEKLALPIKITMKVLASHASIIAC